MNEKLIWLEIKEKLLLISEGKLHIDTALRFVNKKLEELEDDALMPKENS